MITTNNENTGLADGMPVRVCHGDTILTAGERNSFVYTIKDPVGIHARPAGELVKLVKKYKSNVTFSAEGKTADAASIMSIMSLGAVCGTKLRAEASGEDADEVLAALREHLLANL